MNIKFELLQNHICNYIQYAFETFRDDMKEITESTAVKVLEEIREVVGNDKLSDFDAIEEIVCIFEKYDIYCGARHDF